MRVYAAISYGQGGQPVDVLLTGGGIDRLAGRVRLLGARCDVFGWDQYLTIAEKIRALPPDCAVVVGGTSLGANEAPRVAANLRGRAVDLMFGIQPSLLGAKNLVPANVRRAVYFYQPWGGFGLGIGFGLGSYQWQKAPGNAKTVMLSAYSFGSHPGSNVESTQNFVLAEIKKLL